MKLPNHLKYSGKYLGKNRPTAAGFTLVEMVISLGIAGFAFMAIVGLLPFGLQNFRAAMDNTLQAQMAKVLIGKAGQSSYADLSDLVDQSFYFDDSGNLTDASNPEKTYEAKVQVEKQTVIPANSSYTNSSLARITITFVQKGNSGASRPAGSFVTYLSSMTGASQP